MPGEHFLLDSARIGYLSSSLLGGRQEICPILFSGEVIRLLVKMSPQDRQGANGGPYVAGFAGHCDAIWPDL
jgi:hypothetical protein